MSQPHRRAFLDALAWGETEPPSLPHGYGYNVLCGSTIEHPHTFSSYAAFPQWSGWHNPADGSISHAAGRYQFEPRTWRDSAARLHLTDFSPASQDLAAWDLAAGVYHRVTHGRDLEADLLAGETSHVAPVLHSTWTSLSNASFDHRYRQSLAPLAAPANDNAPSNEPANMDTAAPRLLSKGMAGEDVAELQRALNPAGMDPPVTVDGHF